MNFFTEKKSERIIDNSNDLVQIYENNNKIRKKLYSKTITVSAIDSKILQKPTVDYIEHYRNIYSSPENFIKRRVDYGRMKVVDEKLRKESERLKTFHSFPEYLQNLLKPIARSGFYSIANDSEPDKVKCIFCQGILQSWKRSDNPEKEHKKAFPTCPFLLNLNVGNEPLVETVKKTLSIDPDLQNMIEEKIPYEIINPYDNLLRDDLNHDVDWRESTFADSNHLNHFILQGLFIKKIDGLKFIKCHKCSKEIELLNDVCPLPETVFHMPDCFYIRVVKRHPDLQNMIEEKIPYEIIKPYDNLLLRDDLDHDVDWRESTFADSNHLKHFILQGLFIKKIDGLKFLKCHKCSKEIEILKDVCTLPETVFHMPDCFYIRVVNEKNCKNSKQCKEISNIKPGKMENKYPCTVEYSVTNDEIDARLDSRMATQVSSLGTLLYDRNRVKEVIAKKLKSSGQDYESMFELLMDLKSFVKQEKTELNINSLEFILPKNVCVVCLDQPIEVVFLPCGHLKTCKSCSDLLSSCPVCRQVVEKRVWGIRFGLKL